MKKQKLIFKKGVQKIIFPVWRPIGDMVFEIEARKQIREISNRFIPRKNVTWDYEARFNSSVAEVTVSKTL